MNALELHEMTKTYQKGFTLGPLSLTLPQGCILGLVGENGAGKSTTIKLILNSLHASSGRITLLGKDHLSLSPLEREEIGVVLDEASFPLALNAREINLVMQKTYSHWQSDVFRRYLERFSLPENKSFSGFSRGMKMKLAISVALSHQAKFLILDEATSGLDPIVRDEILEIFEDFTRDETHSILLSSHIVSDLEKLCDYIAFLREGKLCFCEEKDRLLDEYGVLHCARQTLEALDPQAVLGVRRSEYGVEALVKRKEVPGTLPVERVSMEELIILYAKGGHRA